MTSDTKEFGLQPAYHRGIPYFELMVNGEPFLPLLTAFERPFAGKLAGSYQPGIIVASLAPDSHGAIAYVCNCGDPDCWSVTVDIAYVADPDQDYVIWHNWANPYRSKPAVEGHNEAWDYSGLMPLVFSRNQYFSEIERARRTSP